MVDARALTGTDFFSVQCAEDLPNQTRLLLLMRTPVFLFIHFQTSKPLFIGMFKSDIRQDSTIPSKWQRRRYRLD